MLGLSQFHGWVGQDLSRAMQSIETVEKSERERERESSSKISPKEEKERPNWRILCFVKGRQAGRKETLGQTRDLFSLGTFRCDVCTVGHNEKQ